MPKKGPVIYEPPKKGFPYLVVSVTSDGVAALPVASRPKAREMVLERRREEEKREKKRRKEA